MSSAPPDAENVDEQNGGRRVSDFELIEPIGEGAYGIVYRAVACKPPRLTRAVKLLIPLPFGGGHGRERFLREVEAISKLSHRAIVTYVTAGFTDEGDPYIVMEYCSGAPLNKAAQELSHDELVEAMVDVFEALQYAHDHNIVHRDIKPSNIMVRSSDNQAQILDFGLAYVWDGLSEKTLTTTMVGSVGYIPPEVQVDPTHRSPSHDLFSGVVTLYEVLAGRRPNLQNYLPLNNVSPDLAGLDSIVRLGLEPETRLTSSCGDVAAALRQWLRRKTAREQLGQSPLQAQIRSALVSNKREAEELNRTAELRRRGLNEAMELAHAEIESAAEHALRSLASLLQDTNGGDWQFVSSEASEHATLKATELVTPSFMLWNAEAPSRSLVFAQTMKFKGVFGRSDEPLIKWGDESRRHRLQRLPQRRTIAQPCWVLYNDAGGGRSHQKVVRGAIVALVTRVDSKTGLHELQLNARPPDFGFNKPSVLEGVEQMRDYWLRAAARAYGVTV